MQVSVTNTVDTAHEDMIVSRDFVPSVSDLHEILLFYSVMYLINSTIVT